MPETALLEANGLTCRFGGITACDDINLQLAPGEVLGIVGESGAGKSTLLQCLAGLVSPSSGGIDYTESGGSVHHIPALTDLALRRLQRSQWGVVHQNPLTGLRPEVSAGGNVVEPLLCSGNRCYRELREAARNALAEVALDPDRVDDRIRDFSGGMQQRVQIARNLIARPRLLYLDEPTGGLDVSVQAQLLDMLRRIVARHSMAAVFVTHDLGSVRLLSHRLAVMREGQIVESGLTDQVLDDPQTPYTQLLVASALAF